MLNITILILFMYYIIFNIYHIFYFLYYIMFNIVYINNGSTIFSMLHHPPPSTLYLHLHLLNNFFQNVYQIKKLIPLHP